MKSGEIYVNSKDVHLAEILDSVDEFTAEAKFHDNEALRIRLLVEETIGMMAAMTGDYDATIELECDDKECRINLVARTEMDAHKKQELLSVSRTGKNVSARGFMGMLSDIIENGLMNQGNVWDLEQDYDGDMVYYGCMGVGLNLDEMSNTAMVWSLSRYKNSLLEAKNRDAAPKEAFEDLEKSVVASMAKDVIVGVKKNQVHLTIVEEIW